MALTPSSFQLTQQQYEAIDSYFAARAQERATANQTPADSVKVEFEWVPGLGRFVTAHFDGEANGLEIEVADEVLPADRASSVSHQAR